METTVNNEVDMPKATLKIETSTRNELKALSTNMEDTFDAIICRLIQEHKDVIKKKKQ